MTPLTVLLIIVILIIVQVIALRFILRNREVEDPKEKEGSEQGLVLLQQQMQELTRTLDERITHSAKTMQDFTRTLDERVADSSKVMQENSHRQFAESTKLIKEITEEVTSVKEIGRQTQGFAEQLKGLQDILKNPKQRGVLGEYYLETVLKNVMSPTDYSIQYAFKNGEIVDAVVFIDKKIVPIDSKFSLENYNRLVNAPESEKPALEKAFVNDLKLRIQETAKYIRPEEGTMDFAFMFIPSEAIYYDLLTSQVGAGESENLIQRAAGKNKVIIVSPTSFLAYLQTVMQGLKAMQIEKRAGEIQKRVGELGKHLGTYETYYRKLGASLGTTVSHFNTGYKELSKIDKDVYRITDTKNDITPELLDKPHTDET